MKWRDTAEYALFRTVAAAVSGLPSAWALACGRAAGHLARGGWAYRRRIVQQQMALAFPDLADTEITGLAAAFYRHLGLSVAEIFAWKDADLAAQVDVVPGWTELDRLMAAGRGVLLVSGHLGNFELGGRVLGARYPLLDVVKPMRNRLFDKYLRRERARHGITTVPMDDSGRAVLSHLRAGGLVTLLVDQDAGTGGVRTDFLGRPASTWPGAARLALRTGSPVVPVAILRRPDGRHVLHIGAAIAVTGSAAPENDVPALTARISAAVEAFIVDCPEQWLWVHRRWKGAAAAASGG